MSKRAYLLLLGLAALATAAAIGITGAVTAGLPPPQGASAASVERLRLGMTPDEVIEVLGPFRGLLWSGGGHGVTADSDDLRAKLNAGGDPGGRTEFTVPGWGGRLILTFGGDSRLRAAAWFRGDDVPAHVQSVMDWLRSSNRPGGP
jgi:hypothetical protein